VPAEPNHAGAGPVTAVLPPPSSSSADDPPPGGLAVEEERDIEYQAPGRPSHAVPGPGLVDQILVDRRAG
jgi:hypothetical protein